LDHKEGSLRNVNGESTPKGAVTTNETSPIVYSDGANPFRKEAQSEYEPSKRTVRTEVSPDVKQVRKTIRRTQQLAHPQEAYDVGLEGVVIIFILSAILLFALLLTVGINILLASLIMIVLITLGLFFALAAVA